jgi:hypothetical protein
MRAFMQTWKLGGGGGGCRTQNELKTTMATSFSKVDSQIHLTPTLYARQKRQLDSWQPLPAYLNTTIAVGSLEVTRIDTATTHLRRTSDWTVEITLRTNKITLFQLKKKNGPLQNNNNMFTL